MSNNQDNSNDDELLRKCINNEKITPKDLTITNNNIPYGLKAVMEGKEYHGSDLNKKDTSK